MIFFRRRQESPQAIKGIPFTIFSHIKILWRKDKPVNSTLVRVRIHLQRSSLESVVSHRDQMPQFPWKHVYVEKAFAGWDESYGKLCVAVAECTASDFAMVRSCFDVPGDIKVCPICLRNESQIWSEIRYMAFGFMQACLKFLRPPACYEMDAAYLFAICVSPKKF